MQSWYQTYVNDIKKYLYLKESDFEQAKKSNGQLRHPVPKSDKRQKIFKIWCNGGHQAVVKDFYSNNKKMIVMNQIKIHIPQPVRKIIKNMISR